MPCAIGNLTFARRPHLLGLHRIPCESADYCIPLQYTHRSHIINGQFSVGVGILLPIRARELGPALRASPSGASCPKNPARFFSFTAVKSTAFCRHSTGHDGGGPRSPKSKSRPLSCLLLPSSCPSRHAAHSSPLLRTHSSPQRPVAARRSEDAHAGLSA